MATTALSQIKVHSKQRQLEIFFPLILIGSSLQSPNQISPVEFLFHFYTCIQKVTLTLRSSFPKNPGHDFFSFHFPSLINWLCSTWHKSSRSDVITICIPSKKTWGKSIPGSHFYSLLRTTGNALKFSRRSKKMDWTWVFLECFWIHPANTLRSQLSWLRTEWVYTLKAEEFACWSPPTLWSQKLQWTLPHVETVASLKKSPVREAKRNK